MPIPLVVPVKRTGNVILFVVFHILLGRELSLTLMLLIKKLEVEWIRTKIELNEKPLCHTTSGTI